MSRAERNVENSDRADSPLLLGTAAAEAEERRTEIQMIDWENRMVEKYLVLID